MNEGFDWKLFFFLVGLLAILLIGLPLLARPW